MFSDVVDDESVDAGGVGRQFGHGQGVGRAPVAAGQAGGEFGLCLLALLLELPELLVAHLEVRVQLLRARHFALSARQRRHRAARARHRPERRRPHHASGPTTTASAANQTLGQQQSLQLRLLTTLQKFQPN